jgi:hypothetical protein
MVLPFRQALRDFLSALKQIGEGYLHGPPGC